MSIFKTLGLQIELQDYFQQVQSLPDDPKYSIPIMAQTPGFNSFFMMFVKTSDSMMPINNPQSLIDDIRHNQMQEHQGIVEINNGKTDSGFPYIYSIIKSQNKEQGHGMEYILTMDVWIHQDYCLNIHGSFMETGTTGMRDAAIFELARREGLVTMNAEKQTVEGWVKDPYDESWEKGALMNLSEQDKFDELFPEHPLTHARIFVKDIKTKFTIPSE